MEWEHQSPDPPWLLRLLCTCLCNPTLWYGMYNHNNYYIQYDCMLMIYDTFMLYMYMYLPWRPKIGRPSCLPAAELLHRENIVHTEYTVHYTVVYSIIAAVKHSRKRLVTWTSHFFPLMVSCSWWSWGSTVCREIIIIQHTNYYL